MQEDTKKSHKKQWETIIITVIIVVILAVVVAMLTYPQILPYHDIQINDLPVSKLNQGYDIICKSRGDTGLCLYNQTSRTIIDTNMVLHLRDKQGDQVTVNVFQINGTKKDYCVKQWNVDWNNTANKECDDIVDFDKSLWTVSTIPDVNGKETVIAFRHDGMKRT